MVKLLQSIIIIIINIIIIIIIINIIIIIIIIIIVIIIIILFTYVNVFLLTGHFCFIQLKPLLLKESYLQILEKENLFLFLTLSS